MSVFFAICLGIAMLAVLATLFLGLFSMAKGGEFAKRYGNRLMRMRVTLQALAIAFFALAAITAGKQ
ncbi:MAG: twin transmembrane helix small protein [Alphaproteobacteria bacterium]|nr:twin transmembrane helix small protein [Alphaproteobacteria bacterium]